MSLPLELNMGSKTAWMARPYDRSFRRIIITGGLFLTFALAFVAFQNFDSTSEAYTPKTSFNRVKPFSGAIIAIGSNVIRGWAINTQDPTSSILLQIDLDQVPQNQFSPNTSDASVTEAFGSMTGHAFSIPLPAKYQDNVAHRLDLHAIQGPVRQLLQTLTFKNGQL